MILVDKYCVSYKKIVPNIRIGTDGSEVPASEKTLKVNGEF